MFLMNLNFRKELFMKVICDYCLSEFDKPWNFEENELCPECRMGKLHIRKSCLTCKKWYDTKDCIDPYGEHFCPYDDDCGNDFKMWELDKSILTE